MRPFDGWLTASAHFGIDFPHEHINDPFRGIVPILQQIFQLQNAAQESSRDFLFALSKDLAQEMVDAQRAAQSRDHFIAFLYLQFEISLAPLHVAIGSGQFGAAYNWILNGFSDSIDESNAREFYDGRPADFFDLLPADVLPHYTASFLSWSKAFYYYCRHQSALGNIATSLAPLVFDQVRQAKIPFALRVGPAVQLMSWSNTANHPIAPLVASLLKAQFDAGALPREASAEIAKAFSTRCCQLIGESHSKWAQVALADYPDHVLGHEKLQIVAATIEDEEDWGKVVSEMVSAAGSYSEELRGSFPSAEEWLIALDQRSSILSPIAKMALDYERWSDFLDVILAWYGVVDPEEREQSLSSFQPHRTGLAFWGHPLVLCRIPDSLRTTNKRSMN